MVNADKIVGRKPTSKRTPPARSTATAEDRRSHIIEAAAQAFMTKGYAATSIDDIARLLGCTKGLIYYNFRNKSELFFAVHQHTIEMNLTAARPMASSGDNAIERLRSMAEQRIESVMDYPAYQRATLLGLEMRIVGSTTPEDRAMLSRLVEMYDEYEELFVRVVTDGMDSGLFAAGDPRLAVKSLLGTLNWMIMWYRPRPDPDKSERARLTEAIVTFILRGLGATS